MHLPLQQGLRRYCYIQIKQKRLSVRVHLPLQQGLRLWYNFLTCDVAHSRTSASSITTRIKTPHPTTECDATYVVRVHLPLQQGLRRVSSSGVNLPFAVRVHLPLQQGLRLVELKLSLNVLICTSASSITTRIKTRLAVS